MAPLARMVGASMLAVLMTGGAAASAHAPSDSAARLGRAVVVIDPEVYDDLVAHGVTVDALGSGSVVPFKGTVKIKLPVRAVDGSTAELGGGIRLTSTDSQLTVRDIAIPPTGFVTGTVRGSDVGNVGPAVLFFQAPSDSDLGDTSLRFTFTFATYVNSSFGTDYAELELFGYSTTQLR